MKKNFGFLNVSDIYNKKKEGKQQQNWLCRMHFKNKGTKSQVCTVRVSIILIFIKDKKIFVELFFFFFFIKDKKIQNKGTKFQVCTAIA